MICIPKEQDDGEASDAESKQDKSSAYNALFNYDDPTTVKYERTPSPLSEGLTRLFDEEADIFIKKEPGEQDIDDLEDFEDIFKDQNDHDTHHDKQERDKPLNGFLPASAVHKRSFSVASKEPAIENNNNGINIDEQSIQKQTETAEEIQKRPPQKKKAWQREIPSDAPSTRTRFRTQRQ